MPPKKRKSSELVRINSEDLTKIQLIGKGGFGSVFHMKWKIDHANELDVAAKQLLQIKQEEADSLEHELGFLSSLDHPNIVRLLGFVPLENINYMLILELCCGALSTFLKDKRNTLSEVLQRQWIEQSARAIEYLHYMNVIHKDIKSDNYLITFNGTLKLADFGLAKWTDQTLKEATHRGTAAYMAPEIFKYNILSFKFDIFAYGVVLWELVTREIPFAGQDRNHIMYKVCNGKRLPIPADCPENLASLMRWCWLDDHHQRPKIKDILSQLRDNTTDSSLPKSLGVWNLQRQRMRGTFGSANGVAISSKTNDQEIAVTDLIGARVKIYSSSFKIKENISFKDRYVTREPYAIAASHDGTYFVTDGTNFLTKIRENATNPRRFDKEQIKIEVPSKHIGICSLTGIAINNSSNLLIGIQAREESYICSFTQEGIALPQMCFKIPIKHVKPEYLAVTSTNAIVISSPQAEQVQVFNHNGRHSYSLDPPSGVTDWSPHGVAGTERMILVANDARMTPNDTGIYSYSISGKYLSCITQEVSCPRGMAVTYDENILMVASSEMDAGVAVFKRDDSIERSIRSQVQNHVSDELGEHVFHRNTSDYSNDENANSLTTTQRATTMTPVRQNDLATLKATTTVKQRTSYNVSHYDDDDEGDTLDLSDPGEDMPSAMPASDDSSRISTAEEALKLARRTTAESDASISTFTGGSLKHLSDNLEWIDLL